MKLKISGHAQIRMDLRGVSLDQIKKCIQRGATSRQTDGMLSTYTYLEVAWKKIGEDCYFIKTVKIKR